MRFLAALALAVAACVAPVTAATAPAVQLHDYRTLAVIPDGGQLCGLYPTGQGFAPLQPVGWEIRTSDGKASSSFYTAATSTGTWRGRTFWPHLLGPLTLTWAGADASGAKISGAIKFESVCLARPAATPAPTPAPSVLPTMPPTDTE